MYLCGDNNRTTTIDVTGTGHWHLHKEMSVVGCRMVEDDANDLSRWHPERAFERKMKGNREKSGFGLF